MPEPDHRRSRYLLRLRVSILVTILAGLVAVMTWRASGLLLEPVTRPEGFDYWFGSDAPTVYQQMVSRHAPWRAHHPLFPLISFSSVYVLRHALDIDPESAVRVFLTGVAVLTVVTLFAALYGLKRSEFEAFLFAALFGLCGSAVFWFPTPETFSLGALSVAAALAMAAWTVRSGPLSSPIYVGVSAFTLSTTLTNWMVAAPMLFVLLGVKRGLKLNIAAAALVLALWAGQNQLFPATQFYGNSVGADVKHIFHPLSGGPHSSGLTFVSHSIVTPSPSEVLGGYLSVQGLPPGTDGATALLAVLIWLTLLVLGSWGGLRRVHPRLWWAFTAALGGQLLLGLTFGAEPFLYSLHFTPLLVFLAAFSCHTPARRFALVLAAAGAIVFANSNLRAFQSGSSLMREHLADRDAFAMRVESLTEPEASLILGYRPGITEGQPAGRGPLPPGRLDSRLGASRHGWLLFFEDWDIRVVERLGQEGAAYFVTRYIDGLAQDSTFANQLHERYQLVETSPYGAIFRLVPASQSAVE